MTSAMMNVPISALKNLLRAEGGAIVAGDVITSSDSWYPVFLALGLLRSACLRHGGQGGVVCTPWPSQTHGRSSSPCR